MATRTPANHQPPLIRPSYRAAVKWVALNDDTEWLDSDDPIPSVTAALIADLFGADMDRVIASIRKEIAKAEGRS